MRVGMGKKTKIEITNRMFHKDHKIKTNVNEAETRYRFLKLYLKLEGD